MPIALVFLALSAATPLVAPSPESGPRVERIDVEEDESADNPWVRFLLDPMGLPWPAEACLGGYAPWGRSSWVKNLSAACFVWTGVGLIAVFPFTLLFVVVMLALSVLAFALAIYALCTGGCHYKSGSRNASNACGSFWDIWTWASCLSFVICSPWLGAKLMQRGVMALNTDLDEPAADDRKPGQRQPRKAPAQPGPGDVMPMSSQRY